MPCKQEEVKVITVETQWKKDAKGADLSPVAEEVSQKVPNGIKIDSKGQKKDLQAGVEEVTKKKRALAKTTPKLPCGKESGCTFFKAGTVVGNWEDAEIKVSFDSPTRAIRYIDIPFTIQVRVTVVTGTCVDLW